MSPQDRKKLERLSRELEAALETIREMIGSAEPAAGREQVGAYDAPAELLRLRSYERSEAASHLANLKQQELGALFVEAGGPATDRKKPKVWLVEQVLWRLFDFERGHEAIRGKSEI